MKPFALVNASGPLPAFLLGLVFGSAVITSARDADGPVLGVAGWMHYDHVFNSSEDKGGHDFSNRGRHSSGAQVSLKKGLSDKLDGAFGLGVAVGHVMNGAIGNEGGYAPAGVFPYIAEANFTYVVHDNGASNLFVRGGFFPYNYNPDVKNLGLYLLRGPVYPGVLISGFETKHILPVANMLGLQIRHGMGDFAHDLILNSETELSPFFDISAAYVAQYRIGKALRIGAGVNLYHVLPIYGKLTRGEQFPGADTISFQGTKLMANAAFDPKAFVGDFGMLGGEDLKLYGEVGLIGLDNDSIHEAYYGKYSNRMPVMVGVNVPAFKFLDHLSLEVQWYGSRIRDDLSGFNTGRAKTPTPMPVADANGNITRDNWKWSLHGARMINSHVKASFQFANDHFRPGVYEGDGDDKLPGKQAILITPKDWYGSLKLAYFF